MSNLNLLSSNSSANTAWASAVPTSIKTTAGAANAALTANSGSASGMGQKDFLTLFTTQLKNQDPLDPVKNEAFVAQLAQFSQLEATVTMSQTLADFVTSMSGERMMSSTNMIGKTVAVPNAPALYMDGKPVKGLIPLPEGASGLQLQVINDKGNVIATQILGPQQAGDVPLYWDGSDDTGNQVPDGLYTITASAVVQGKNTNPIVSIHSTVTGVNQTPDKTIMLEVAGGKSVKLTDVQRIGG
jgi:flagellar basal-body rod modification protein FlgD